MRQQIREQPDEAVGEQVISGFIHVEIAQDEEGAESEEDGRADLEPAVATEMHFGDE